MIKRTLEDRIDEHLFRGSVVTLFGARRTGKTTLVKSLMARHADKRARYLNCELQSVQQALEVQEAELIKAYIGDYDLVVLDESQNIKRIDSVLKTLSDARPKMQIIATGSSALDLPHQMSDALAGRLYPFEPYALSLEEIAGGRDYSAVDARLERFLRFGMYPAIIDLSDDEAAMQLDELVANYLYKDVLTYVGAKRSAVITDLVRLLALRAGTEISYTELAAELGIDRKTVIGYIGLLERCFVVFRLYSYSRSVRKEVVKAQKIYFYDVGVRNALLLSFAPMALRTDAGPLWENFCIVERIKMMENHGRPAGRYFWRTSDQKEVDYLEEKDEMLTGFEFEWSRERRRRLPASFLEGYPGSKIERVDQTNYWQYLL
jgi:uncharacterized protein